ncbi:hypothetical protein A0J61_10783 [Choanephora cucurbitarum]|uniref:CCHC-type domain-containing protein n=1 Tax=Choanephora cucurbitarum TaxID=101091 RepID=A0A1C7MWL6_9FUNG|nr:hypothetical protein A0J61_10783 [Choanephora cucurbitarum]
MTTSFRHNMALPANTHKRTIQTPTTYKTNKKSWVDAVNEGIRRTSSSACDPSSTKPSVEPGQLPESAVRDVYSHVARPFLKGTVSNSLLIDITATSDIKTFIQELHEVRNGNYSRVFAEIVVSPSKYSQFIQAGFKLKTQGNFSAFPSLSSSSEILKISLSGLSSQYGRLQGGLDQLCTDMCCGQWFNHHSTGVYTENGYVVLEIKSSESSNSPPHSLSNLIDYSYQPINYQESAQLCLHKNFDRVQVKATWASMPPFCRFCHSPEHALADCLLRRKATTCFHCNELGHISRVCPRKNSGVGKKRKTPVANVSSTAPLESYADSQPRQAVWPTSVPSTSLVRERSSSSQTSSPIIK